MRRSFTDWIGGESRCFCTDENGIDERREKGDLGQNEKEQRGFCMNGLTVRTGEKTEPEKKKRK